MAKTVKEGKISISHYLNTRLKGKPQNDGQFAYPVYIRITVKRQQTQIKSRFNQLIAPDDFEGFKREYSSFLKQEVNQLTTIIRGLNAFDSEHFHIQQATNIYANTLTPLTEVIENCLKSEIKETIVKCELNREKFTEFTDKVDLVIAIEENSLINLIDWKKPASVILSNLREVIVDLQKPLLVLFKEFQSAFSFDSKYNALYAEHLFPYPPILTDWQSGDFKKYITDLKSVDSIDILLKKHHLS